jgi:hypothetical protein
VCHYRQRASLEVGEHTTASGIRENAWFLVQILRALPPSAAASLLSPTMSTPNFSVPAAYIVALPVQCVFFGLALATFLLCVRALCAIPTRDFTRTRWALLAVSIATIVVGAVSIGQAIAHNLFAFVYYKGGGHAMEALDINQYPAVWIHVCPSTVPDAADDADTIC